MCFQKWYHVINLMKLFELFSICYSQQPNIKLQDRFISLEAYGFGSTDNGPHEYYFEINLFESINIEVNYLNLLILR